MAVTVRWRGQVVAQAMESAVDAAVKRAAALVMIRARVLCSRPAKRIRVKRKRTTSAGPRGSQYTIYAGSAPGQPPMVRTGFGRRSIIMDYDPPRKVARAGPTVNAAYMAYLELGTEHIEPRPWLLPAMRQSEPQVMMILTSTLQRVMGK